MSFRHSCPNDTWLSRFLWCITLSLSDTPWSLKYVADTIDCVWEKEPVHRKCDHYLYICLHCWICNAYKQTKENISLFLKIILKAPLSPWEYNHYKFSYISCVQVSRDLYRFQKIQRIKSLRKFLGISSVSLSNFDNNANTAVCCNF